MAKIQICDAGAVNLAVGIASQAVNDYIDALKKIYKLQGKESAYKAIRKRALKSKKPRELTDEEAETERLHMIAKKKDMLAEIERFFHSEWYAELCELDGDFMIAKAEGKYREWLNEQKCNIAKNK